MAISEFWKDKSNKAAFEHARLLTAEYSRSFYFSAKMLPKRRRWATYAVYGFCRYADNMIDNPRNRSRQELLEEIDSLAKELQIAYRTGESENPIIRPFIIAAKQYGIPIKYPLELLKGVKMDIEEVQYKTFDDLYLFCYRVAAVVGLMMTHVLGYKDKNAFDYAEKLGIAMQLTNILRDIKEDKEHGRVYLPADELKRFRVSKANIMQERMTPAFRKLMRFQVKRAHQFYMEADKGIKMLNRESQFAIYSASKIYQGILFKIETRNFNPFLGRVFVPQMKKIGIVLQEILRTKVFTFLPRKSIITQIELLTE